MVRWAVSMARTASLSEASGARLKLMVSAGNWSWWVTASGAVVYEIDAMASSGTCAPLVEGMCSRDRPEGSRLYCSIDSSTTRYWFDWP
jgi:hypothetical protein